METPALPMGSRRNEDIALDLMKFIAMTTGYGKTTGTGVGFQGTGAAAKPCPFHVFLHQHPEHFPCQPSSAAGHEHPRHCCRTLGQLRPLLIQIGSQGILGRPAQRNHAFLAPLAETLAESRVEKEIPGFQLHHFRSAAASGVQRFQNCSIA